MGAGQALGSMLWCEVVNRENLSQNRSLWMDPTVPLGHLSRQCHYSQGFVPLWGLSLLPRIKGGMSVCAQIFQQTCTFASCFRIFLPFLTTTENTACVFPFPPTHRRFRQHEKHKHSLHSAGPGTNWRQKKWIKIPTALLQCLRKAAMPGSLGSKLPRRWWRLPGKMRRCFEREAVILSGSPRRWNSPGTTVEGGFLIGFRL